MSNSADDSRNGFKSSRIDLSQLGDDTWNKPFAGNPTTPGPRKRATAPVSGGRRANLDDVFEGRVHAATARRTVKQNRGQNRVWLFAGGLFLASVGGIAAAYYLVGPPMAMSSYGTDGAGYQAAQTSSLEVDGNVVGTSSHFQGVPVSATIPDSTTTDYSTGASVMAQPSADRQPNTDAAPLEPVAPAISEQPAAADAIAADSKAAEAQQDAVTEVETPVAAPPKTVMTQPETERMVRIIPAAVSKEVETKTNVNAAKAAAASDTSAGQWVALPAETKPADPSVVTAVASQQSGESNPVAGPAKTQQELFKAFQEYLESSGHTAKGNDEGQEALFNKFIRWSVEAPKEN
jgi:hypothetical protein